MTRINANIKPIDLTDQHLLAEYREIVRIPNAVKANLDNAYKKVKQAPQMFKLGTGHVIYFYDKIKFLHERFLSLKDELKLRGIETNMNDEMFNNIPNDLYNDFPEDQIDLANSTVAIRIYNRIETMKRFPTHYKNKVCKSFAQKMIKSYI